MLMVISIFSMLMVISIFSGSSFFVLRNRQIIYDEYIVRYCERIGATPTPSTLEAIRKQIPIDQCRMTAAWKSRGWNADCINVQARLLGISLGLFVFRD
jgi:hypothetical protein